MVTSVVSPYSHLSDSDHFFPVPLDSQTFCYTISSTVPSSLYKLLQTLPGCFQSDDFSAASPP